MNISQNVLDNLVSYTHVIISREYNSKLYDKVRISYYETKGLFKKHKIITEQNILFSRIESYHYSHFGGQDKMGTVSPETEKLKELLDKYLPSKKPSGVISELEKEYSKKDDDFSMGVLFAISVFEGEHRKNA